MILRVEALQFGRELLFVGLHIEVGLEHADPKDLIASMRGHEAEVMRLLGEIEALVDTVDGE